MLELLRKRRSIRKYKDKPIEKEKIAQLVQAALLSPSSRNLRPWEFIVVTDKDVLEKLSAAKPGAGFIKNAQLAVVVLGNPSICDVWIEDTSIATTIIHLTAESLGLGSCWIQIRERKHDENTTAEEYIRNVLNIPQNVKVLSMVSIGYPDEVKPPYKEEDLQYHKVHLNMYNNRFTMD
jgi:nitroreductase